jgi:hypothetical protein
MLSATRARRDPCFCLAWAEAMNAQGFGDAAKEGQ